LRKLGRLIQLSIPTHAYAPELIALYEQITTCYYEHIFPVEERQHTESRPEPNRETINPNDHYQHLQSIEKRTEVKPKTKGKINYLELATFITNFSAEQETEVSEELIQMGRAFSSWEAKDTTAPELPKLKNQKPEYKDRKKER
jgi:hypothetical protein